ncbi:ATP-binding response regulator [Candidatus Methylomirabilis limnetica]|jgi:signal transduction histidine kinase|nr:ATP-binding protein [Candidatus Methylomirabilis limnetica]
MNEKQTPVRVLIVDDNPGKRAALAAALEGLDLALATVDSGAQALRELLAQDFALALLDVNMPIMDGFETATMIRGRPRSAHLPIIFVTAERDADSTRLQGYALGAVDYIASPIIPEILRAKVAVFADLYRLRERSERNGEELLRKSEQIERQNLLLQYANRMKDEFLANTSHELRAPLNSIIGFAELLATGQAGPLKARQTQFASIILDSGRRLLSVINDILDLATLEVVKVALEPGEITLPALLQDCLTLVKGRAFKHRINLALQIAPGVDAMRADARRLKQILYNLLSNAVKFTADGGKVALSARHARRTQAGTEVDGVEFAVTDSGIGIAAGDIDKLFQPFVQLDAAGARRYEGSGLGLVISRRLAELHGGAVEVQSEPGQGSCFTVWLPLAPPASAAAAERGSTKEIP